MTTLKYTGARTRPFTIHAPGGDYPVEPEVNPLVEMTDEDAAWFMQTAAPEVWSVWTSVNVEFAKPATSPKKSKG